jgi:hypothetical protein
MLQDAARLRKRSQIQEITTPPPQQPLGDNVVQIFEKRRDMRDKFTA